MSEVEVIYQAACNVADPTELLGSLESADLCALLKHAVRKGVEGAPGEVGASAMGEMVKRFLREHG